MHSATRWAPAMLLGATIMAGGLATPAAAQRIRSRMSGADRIDTTLVLDRGVTVELINADGDVHVTGSPDNRAHFHGRNDDGGLRFTVTSGRVTLEAVGSGDAEYEITLPRGTRVIARTRSGDVSVRGTEGEVEIHTQNGDIDVSDVATRLAINTFSGDITANNIAGDVSVSTISGDLHASDLRGAIDVGTVSGDIELRGVTSKQAHAKTTNGDVTYDGAIDPAGAYEFHSHSGDIRLRVQRDASARLTVQTFTGSVDSDFPITLKPGEQGIGLATAKHLTFDIGGGGARITADTFSGDINISANGRGSR